MNEAASLLSTAEEIQELAALLQKQEIFAFDTEFIRESTFFPIVEIIQIATEAESWLVDAQAFKKSYKSSDPFAFDPGLKPLLEVLSNPKILKVAHAIQGDQECLYTSFGCVAAPTLDTAVAASLCGYGDGIGLGKLLQAVLDVHLTKGHARTNWSARPLPKQLLEYAHADVRHLVKLGKTLLDQLKGMGRQNWALQLSAKWENQALYQADPEGIAHKLARGKRLDKTSYHSLIELVHWRETRVRQLNLPRRWVADDQVLLDLAQVRPKDLAHLSTFRGLSKGELKNSGNVILAALQKQPESPEDIHVPKVSRSPIPTPEEAQALELLHCYIGILAHRHRISSKHLMNDTRLLALLRDPCPDTEGLKKSGFLTEEAIPLIGQELVEMLKGKRTLLIQGDKVEVRKLD